MTIILDFPAIPLIRQWCQIPPIGCNEEVREPGLFPAFDRDPEQARQTHRHLLASKAESGQLVLTAHLHFAVNGPSGY